MSRDFLIITLGRVLQSLIGVAAIRLLTTLLTPSEVGNFYLITSVMGVCIFVLISPLGMYINRKLHKWHEDGVVMWWLRGYHFYLIAVVFASMFFVFCSHKYFGIGSSIPLLGFMLIVSSNIYCATCNQTIIPSLNMLGKRLGFVVFTLLTLGIGLVCSSVYVMYIAPIALLWIAGQVTAMAVVTPFALLYFNRVAGDSKDRITAHAPDFFADLPSVLYYAWPLVITYFFMWAQSLSYRVIVEKIVGPEFLGFVGVGLGIAASLAVALESIVHQMYFPVFYAEINTPDPGKRAVAWNKMARVAFPLYLSFTIMVSALAPFILRILADAKFGKAWAFLLCGAWVELCRMTTNILAGAAHSEMKTKSLIKAYLWGAVITILGTYFAAQSGSRGILVPGVLVCSGLVMLLTMYAEMHKILKIETASFGLKAAILYSSPFLLIPLLYRFRDSLYASLAAVALCGVYFILWQYRTNRSILAGPKIFSAKEERWPDPIPRPTSPNIANRDFLTTSYCVLTIAIPTYNGVGTLKNTLDSVLPQLEDGVEVLVLDNCSTENPAELLAEYSAKYKNLRLIRNAENIGYDRNVDLAMRQAKGEFVWLLGDDDMILPGGISKVLGIISVNPGLGVIFVNCPHTITVRESDSGICRDGDSFFLKTRFKNGFVSTNIFNKALWAATDTREYYDTGWIHVGFLIKALQGTLSYVEAGYFVDYLRQSPTAMRWGEGGSFFLTGIELSKIYKRLSSLGYNRKTVRNAYLSVKGGYWRNIPLAKAKGLKINKSLLLDCFCLYKGFFSFWVIDLPLLLCPSQLFRFLLKGYRFCASRFKPRTSSGIDADY